MNSDIQLLEQRIYSLNQQLDHLNHRVAHLEETMTATATKRAKPSPAVTSPQNSETEPLLQVDSSSILKHISILCFLLVAALGLRALTDNAILTPQTGSILGIVYAAILMACGHHCYRKQNTLAPIFAVTGALVLFSVIVETHARFESLPDELVYIMLAVTGSSMAYISYRNKAALPILVGTLGMCFAAVAIDYPNPYFPYLILILWLSNILGFFATRIKRCSWLRWMMLITTHAILQTWGLKISGIMANGQKPESLAPGLFIPMVILIGFTFTIIALLGIIRSGNERVSKFDFSLPTVNAAWCYVAAIYALKNPAAFGPPAAIAALAYFGLAYWLSKRSTSNAQGTNTFIAGGLILSCLSLPALLGNLIASLPVLAILAFICSVLSHRWSSGGMRVSSYLLQAYISAVFIIELTGRIHSQSPSPAILAAALFCGLIALIQFRFCRKHMPPAQSLIFSRYDSRDQSALMVFFTSMINLFYASILLTYMLLERFYHDDLLSAFRGSQSVIINVAACILLIFALMRHNTELRNAGLVILLAGGGKAFILDIFNLGGTWLVASILSFAIAAALSSIILARWATVTSQTTRTKSIPSEDPVSQQADPEPN